MRTAPVIFDDGALHNGVILLDNLCSLKLKCASEVKVLLDGIQCPALSNIGMEGGMGVPSSWPQHELFSFLSRSSCILARFAVRRVAIQTTQLIDCLKMMPSLVILFLDDIYMDRDFSAFF
jgi:hypothetical protein